MCLDDLNHATNQLQIYCYSFKIVKMAVNKYLGKGGGCRTGAGCAHGWVAMAATFMEQRGHPV